MWKHEHVLALMKSKGGKIDLSDPDLHAILGRLMYRVSVYMSFIRRFCKLDVQTLRDGRTVVGYTLVEVNPQATDDARWRSSKYLKSTSSPAPQTAATV